MTSDDHRLVILVIVDSRGRVCGQTEQRVVAEPHWQEMTGIPAAFPGAIVLRLLHVIPGENECADKIYYLAQYPDHQDMESLAVCDLPESIFERHELRMPWAFANGPADDLKWARQFIVPIGDPIQHRTWNLSAVWSIPTAAGVVWLKCVPPFFQHEARVIELLAGHAVPEVIAHENHRILLRGMPGKDGYGCNEAQRISGIEQLVAIQRFSTTQYDQFVAASVPVFSLAQIAEECEALLYRRKAEALAADFLAALPDTLAAIADSDIADVLVHGDFHAGNTRVGVTPPIVFDWGDSFLGHPFLDMARLPSESLVGKWLALWQQIYPLEDIEFIWGKLRPLARLRTALLYDKFVSSIEPAERIYHEEDIDECIEDFQA